MGEESDIRTFARRLVDRTDTAEWVALLDLLAEDYFSPEEIEVIRRLRCSGEWADWRSVRICPKAV